MRSQLVRSSRLSTVSAVVAIAFLGLFAGVMLAVQSARGVAHAASSGPTAGVGLTAWGSSYANASGVDRYSYVSVGLGDAAAAAAQPGKSLVYASGTTVRGNWGSIETGVPLTQAQANGWLLKDASGNLLKNVVYNAYVGDIGSLAYQQAWVSNVEGFLAANHDDGVWIDDVLIDGATLTGGVYPAKYPSQAAWQSAMVSFIAYVGQALKSQGYYVLAQAVGYVPDNAQSNSGALTASFWRQLAPYVSGLCSEYWIQLSDGSYALRPSGTASWTQQWDGWQSLVSVAQGAGVDFFGMVYGSGTDVRTMRYAKASFLLDWDGGGGALMYVHLDGSDPWSPEWTMDIGQPAGAKYQVGSGWRRDYANGTVILNPSPSASQTFNLGGTYTEPDGTAVSSVTLAPTTALVLKGSQSAPPPPPTTTTTTTTTTPAPVSSALPVVSGTAQDGSSLSASTGTWSGSPSSYAYQWQRCSTSCTSVSGATSSSYALTSVDVGHTMRVAVTASNAGGSSTVSSAATAVVAAAPAPQPPAAPVNTAVPVVSGTTQAGSSLSASTGTWSGSPTSYAYRWSRCSSSCSTVSGATSASYALSTADVGYTMQVAVTASNAGGASTASSVPTALIHAPPVTTSAPVDVTLPTISIKGGGSKLVASTGTWANTPVSFGYAWHRCDAGGTCTVIGGATGSTYATTSADVGMRVCVTVTAHNAGGSGDATSPKVGPMYVHRGTGWSGIFF